MFSFFSPDNKFMQIVERFADLFVLNILFLITCLPVFTVGAAATALYSVCFRMLENREGRLLKDYFRAFRENFRQGTVLWFLLLFLAVPAFLYFDKLFALTTPLRWGFVPFLTVLVLTLMAGAYGFALLSRFDNTVGNTLKNALLLSIRHLPRSFCLLGIWLLPWALLALNGEFFLRISYLWLALYFSAAAYCSAALLKGVFDPLAAPEV